jgi:prevent-host-death family protein
MKIIPASKFKAECLSILDDVDSEGVVITKHGKPVARLIPYEEKNASFLIGALKGKMKIKGNIFSTGRTWNAQKGEWKPE